MEHLSNDHKDHPNMHENSHKLCDETGILFWVIGKTMETETTTWLEFSNGEKGIIEQILVSEEINKFKSAGLWESQSGIQVGKLTLWIRSFKIEKL